MELDYNQLLIGSMAMVVLGYVLKQVVNYFIGSAKRKDEYIQQLVADNATNVTNFVNTINHNQTKMNDSIDKLTEAMSVQTDVFTHIINDKIIPRSKRRTK